MCSKRVEDKDEICVKVRVVPRAKKNQISGFMEDGSLKVRLTAPPVNGKANRALVELLAHSFKIPRSNISIVSGLQGRNKSVIIGGLSIEEYQKTIDQLT